MQELTAVEEEIFKKSLSYDYFWRNLISILLDSKVEDSYWQDYSLKHEFKEKIRSQMLDGDCFELIDGRNLEMRQEILKEILEPVCASKCIVVTVIGP